MKPTLPILAAIAAVIGIMSIGESSLQSAMGYGASAQVGGSCYNNCRYIKQWSRKQCRIQCQGRP
jgi:hypothetical protein